MKQLIFKNGVVIDRVVGPFADSNAALTHIHLLGYEYGGYLNHQERYWFKGDNRTVIMGDYIPADKDFEPWEETIYIQNVGSKQMVAVEQWQSTSGDLCGILSINKFANDPNTTVAIDIDEPARKALIAALERLKCQTVID